MRVPFEVFGRCRVLVLGQLLHLYNEIWDSPTSPADWGWAKVVSNLKGKVTPQC